MLRTPLHGVRICRSSNDGRSDCSSWSSREAIRLGFFLGEDFRRGLADHVGPGNAPEGLAGAVDQHVLPVAGLLHEDRRRNVFQDEVEELAGSDRAPSRLADAR